MPPDVVDNPAPETGDSVEGLPANDPAGEGTTPEEVAGVLKSSGMKLPETKTSDTDDEEGDDPDAQGEDASNPDSEEAAADPSEEAADDTSTDEEESEHDTSAKRVPPPEVAADEDKYSFEVEDDNDVTFKITADADIESILKDFEPKNNGQIIAILDQLRTVKEQKAADEQQAEKDNAETARQERADDLLKGWGEEAKALQGSKRIAEGDDGDKRIDEVYKFMSAENTKRMESGQPTLNSFEDALDKLENKEARDKAVADAKSDKEDARKNGALVGGSSAASSTAPPVYKANSARNANQALKSMGLLK